MADRNALLKFTSARRLRTARRHGLIIRVVHGSYALATAQSGLVAARKLSGIASHESAAVYHGWSVKVTPELAAVIVPRHRKLRPSLHPTVKLRYRDIGDDHDGLATKMLRTVIDCARDLPFDRALAVADSALRSGTVDHDELIGAAQKLKTRGRTQALRVAHHASPVAANPFESVLRAIALDVDGLHLQPQITISEYGFECRPDLVDEVNRIVVEADSFEFHSNRQDLAKDIERYTHLVARGWRVLRFAWEHVMLDPAYVRECLVALVEGPYGLAIRPKPTQMAKLSA